MQWFFTFLLFLLVSPSLGDDLNSQKLTVYAVNYPLKYFTERIAGEHAKVVFPAPAEGDPAYWMPDAKTIAGYQKADLIGWPFFVPPILTGGFI